jgi:hypothetical protein
MEADVFDPGRHAIFPEQPWDPNVAARAVDEIVADVSAKLNPDGLWPGHPRDDRIWDNAANLYIGGGGVLWALDLLRRQGVEVALDLPPLLARVWEAHRAESERYGDYGLLPSLLMGDLGLLVLELHLAPRTDTAERLQQRITASLDLPVRELMWGLAGAMIACLEAHDLIGGATWRQLFEVAGARLIADLRDSEWGPIWVQDLYGRTMRWIGPVHGYAGNMAPLLRGWDWLREAQREAIARSVDTVLPATARRVAAGANWPAVIGKPHPRWLVQHCHGAPGIVTTFAASPLRSDALTGLLLEGGALTWAAGPLLKGSNLCHGTGGNGYAFLRLWTHTGDPIWLERARTFAMWAIHQCRTTRTALGRGRFTLWTGDPGLAVYLRACIIGNSSFPTVDAAR